jgi:hypothetical protein
LRFGINWLRNGLCDKKKEMRDAGSDKTTKKKPDKTICTAFSKFCRKKVEKNDSDTNARRKTQQKKKSEKSLPQWLTPEHFDRLVQRIPSISAEEKAKKGGKESSANATSEATATTYDLFEMRRIENISAWFDIGC